MKPLIGLDTLERVLQENQAGYGQAEPFPHAVIDHFIDDETVRKILAVFPDIRQKTGTHEIYGNLDDQPAQYRKKWLAMALKVDPLIRQLYGELQSADFISFLETLTGITGLLPDPHFLGGGVHETETGGYLLVHADFNLHPTFHYYRRLNLLIYLNEGWQADWGGELELWDAGCTHCIKSVSPLAGRAVLFSTSSHSFHGHPKPLKSPAGITRKSIALYYYARDPGPGCDDTWHSTVWKRTEA